MLMKDERFFKTIKNFLEIYLLKQKTTAKIRRNPIGNH